MGLEDNEYKEISKETLKQMIGRAVRGEGNISFDRGFVFYGSNNYVSPLSKKKQLEFELENLIIHYEMMKIIILKKHCT